MIPNFMLDHRNQINSHHIVWRRIPTIARHLPEKTYVEMQPDELIVRIF
ncbi:MAG: hypothetical protein ABIO55_15475 [Ginsengibacter sp.]